jgi:hypothetical protein
VRTRHQGEIRRRLTAVKLSSSVSNVTSEEVLPHKTRILEKFEASARPDIFHHEKNIGKLVCLLDRRYGFAILPAEDLTHNSPDSLYAILPSNETLYLTNYEKP